MKQEQISLRRLSSSNGTNNKVIPSSHFARSMSSTSSFSSSPGEITDLPLALGSSSNGNSTLSLSRLRKTRLTLTSFLRSLLQVFTFSSPSPSFAAVPTCRWLAIPGGALSLSSSPSSPAPLGRRVTGTLFGRRKGHVTFAVQDGPGSDPALLVELPVSTSALVREMSSGLVRIALECRRGAARGRHAPRLLLEPTWTVYCNGRRCGHSASRARTELDSHVLRTVRSVSVGAGVIPLAGPGPGPGPEGEVLYMRARFERVVGSRDAEAFYMLNPDGNGGPELSIFLLRL